MRIKRAGEMERGTSRRAVSLLLLCSLLLALFSPVALAQRRGNTPAEDFLEPAKQVLTTIVDIFSLDWLGNDAASYAAFARVVIFIVMFVLVREVLARFGHLSSQSSNVIAVAVALMGTVFMPESFLIGMGTSYAAVFMAVPIIFILYLGFRISRTTDTSTASGKLRFVTAYILLFCLLVFVGSQMLRSPTGKQIFNVSLDMIIWIMYGVTLVYMILNFFTKGLGADWGSGSVLDLSESGEEEHDKEKGKAVKDTERVRGLLEKAGTARDVLRRWARQQAKGVRQMFREDEVDLQEIKIVIQDLLQGLQAAHSSHSEGDVRYHDTSATYFKRAIKDALKHIGKLKKHLKQKKKLVKQHRRNLISQTRVIREAEKDDEKAEKLLEKKKGALLDYISGDEISSAVKGQLRKLDKTAERILEENEKKTKSYEDALKKERAILRRVKRALSKMSDELEKAEKLLKDDPEAADVEKAVRHLQEMQKLQEELLQEDKVELTYATQKEIFERKQEEVEAEAIKIDDAMEKLLVES